MLKKLKKFSFFYRLLWMIWLFILLPIVLVGYVSLKLVSAEVTDRIEKSNREVVEVVQERVSRMIEDITFSANVLVQDPSFIREADSIAQMDNLTTFEQSLSMQSMLNTISFVETKTSRSGTELFVINEGGMVVTNRSPATLKPIWPLIKSHIKMDNAQTMQWVRNVDVSQDKSVYAVRLLRSQSGKRIGAAVIVLPYSFFEGMNAIHEYGLLSISDRDGNLLWQSSKNGDAADSDDTSPKGKVLHNAKRVDAVNWTIEYTIQRHEITGSISRLFLTFSWIIAVFVVIFLVLAVWMVRRMYKPLLLLQKTASVFSSGDLKVRYRIQGKDEIAFLGSAFNRMLDQIEELVVNIQQEQEEKKVIELTALSGQIRPHFLLNTLNAFKCSLALSKDGYHSGKIDSLMSLLRAYMRVHVPSTLAKESKLLTDYVEIMNIRNIQNVQLLCEFEAGLEHYAMPSLFIQPIVENCIIHGLLQKEGDAWIRITARRQSDQLHVIIEDNGVGIEEEKLRSLNKILSMEDTSELPQEQVGLLNVKKRMKLTYGKEASLSVEKRLGDEGGISFRFILPI